MNKPYYNEVPKGSITARAVVLSYIELNVLIEKEKVAEFYHDKMTGYFSARRVLSYYTTDAV